MVVVVLCSEKKASDALLCVKIRTLANWALQFVRVSLAMADSDGKLQLIIAHCTACDDEHI